MEEFTDTFPEDNNAAGPVAGDTEGEIDPEKLFVNQEDIDFFRAVGEDWANRAAE